MRTQKVLSVAVFACLFNMLGGLVSAHHSTAGYDKTKTVPLKGTVAEWVWRNPHVILVWDVKDANGKVQRWYGEMQSPISNTGMGLNRNSFKPGDELIVTVNPGANGQALVLTIADGQGKMILDRNRFGEDGTGGNR
jgi:Family of unknown function (DUF6152)